MQISKDKQRITNCFNRAAGQYTQVNHIQCEVSQKLLTQLAAIGKSKATIVLDLGCGLGLDGKSLGNLFPNAQIFLIDRAQNMLKAAAKNNVGNNNISMLCADFDALPIHTNSCAIIYCNMAMQWSMDITRTLTEIYRVMKPGGVTAYSLPINGTYQEIIACQIKMENHRFNRFLTTHQFVAEAKRVGFNSIHQAIFTSKIYYESAKVLFKSIRKMGAQHIKNNASTIYQKAYYQQLLMSMESFREPEGVPLSYSIAYGVLIK